MQVDAKLSESTDPIEPIAAAAMAHMNSDHADALLAYAKGIAGLAWVERATVQAIDARGLDVQVQGSTQVHTARIPFDAPLTSAEQLRPALVALAQRARIQVSEPVVALSPAPERDADTAARLLNAISTRRSFGLKEVAPAPIDLALIERMLEAAIWAPSHGKTEPWRFVVYSGEGRRVLSEAFGAAYRALTPANSQNQAAEQAQRDRAWQAPVWIALGMMPDPNMPEWEELIAFGSAVQNAHLMASALGLACKWTSGDVVRHAHVAQAIGFAPDTQLFGFLYVGNPTVPWPESKRKPVSSKVRWVNR
jgi:nitroreductase